MENQLFDFIAKYMPLTEAEKKVITDLSLVRNYKKGTLLVEEGKVPTDYYFVLKGCLRCYYNIDGEEKTTAFYTESESYAPPSVATRTSSDCYLDCIEDCVLLVANPEIEQETFEKFPRFETLCRLMSEDLLAKNQAEFDTFKTSNPEQRYLNLLNTRPDLVKRVPLSQLASYIGITRESLSRIRKRLQLQDKS